jgi:hypothetical protein
MFDQITSIPGYQVYIWLLAIFGSATIHLLLTGARSRPALVEVLLIYLAGIGGFIGIISFFMHTIWADLIVTNIGWPAGNHSKRKWAWRIWRSASSVMPPSGGGIVCFTHNFASSFFGLGPVIPSMTDILSHGNFSP